MAEDSPSAGDFAAAGLYDPSAPDAPERLALLRWLTEQGFSLDDLVRAAGELRLEVLAADTSHRTGVHLSAHDVARSTGLPPEVLVEVRRASGLVPVPDDALTYTEGDLAAFDLLGRASELFSWDQLMQFVRVAGTSLARVADAANTLFLHDVEHPLKQAGGTGLDLAQHTLAAMNLSGDVSTLLRMLWRLHLEQAIDRNRAAYLTAEAPGLMVPMAVGFVDLVGFTPRAAWLEPEQLAALVSRFEATAHNLVTDLGGRLVKLIGDEVMFVAVEAATGCDIAAALLTTFGQDPALTPRGGLAHGDVLARAGDYFGPTVNLAARLAEQAVPGEVLATPDVAAAAGHHHVEPAGRRLLKGFAEPVTVVSLTAAPIDR